METNLSTDCCPVDCSSEDSHVLDSRHIGKPGLFLGKQDYENRCESGYKSCDDGFLSEPYCKSYGERISESDENIAVEEDECVNKDNASTIDSIDEGICSINLSTEILAERCKTPLKNEDLELQNRAKWFKHAFQQVDDGETPLKNEDLELQNRAKWFKHAFQQDDDGDTDLHTSIIQMLQTLAFYLISLVPHPDFLSIQNNYLQTPLHLAVITKQPALVRKLISAGAEVEVRDHWGNTALHIACKEADLSSVQQILLPVKEEETRNNPYKCHIKTTLQNLEARNYEGKVCLHLAAERGNRDILRELLSRGANINTRDGKSGRSVLHYAAESGDEEMAKFLLDQPNIDVNCETYGGLTPVKLAKGRCHIDIIRMLRDRGAYYYSDDSEEEEMETQESISDDFAIAGKPVTY